MKRLTVSPRFALSLALLALAGASIQAQQPVPSYHVASKVKLGREGGWD